MALNAFYFTILPGILLTAQVHSRAVNITSSWTLPQEGFPHFFRYFQTQVNWIEAKQACESFQGELLTVENNERRDAARAYLKELDVLDNVWCGLERSSIEAPFVWTGGGKGPLVGDGFWQEANSLEPEQQCVAINPLYDFRWQSFPCAGPQAHSFVCQLTVPEWAQGEDGCLLKSLPSLTVTYLPEPGIVELLSDCGLSGTKRIACKGGESQADLMKRLSCDREEDSRSSTLGWTERSSRGHHETLTTSDWATQMTKSWGTRHKRESGGTSPPTETTGGSNTGGTVTVSPMQSQRSMSTKDTTVAATSITNQRQGAQIEDTTTTLLGMTMNIKEISSTAIPTALTSIISKLSPSPDRQNTVTTSPVTEEVSEGNLFAPTHQYDIVENDNSNEIPIIGSDTVGAEFESRLHHYNPSQSVRKLKVDDVITESHVGADLGGDRPLQGDAITSKAIFDRFETSSGTTRTPIAESSSLSPTPEQESEKIELTQISVEGASASPELSFLGNISEDVVILDERTQDAGDEEGKHHLPLTDPENISQKPKVNIDAINTTENVSTASDITTYTEASLKSQTSSQGEENVDSPFVVQYDKENREAVILSKPCNKFEGLGLSFSVEFTDKVPPPVDTKPQRANPPIIVIADVGDGETKEITVVESSPVGTSESQKGNLTWTAADISHDEATTAIQHITMGITEEETSTDFISEATDHPQNVIATEGRDDKSSTAKKREETTPAVNSNEPKDTTFDRTTHVPFHQDDSTHHQDPALEEQAADELENQKRPNRGRLFPHSNPLSFYPYFLNRVLG